MYSLNDFEEKKQQLLKNLNDYKKHSVEVNNFISNEISKNYRNKQSFIAGTFKCFNADQYGNEFDLISFTVFGELMSKVIESNPKLKLQLLQQYRSELASKIRMIEIAIDEHTNKAIQYLKEQELKKS